jgi:large subunit ribosomal protein L13
MIQHLTQPTKGAEIVRKWHIIDVKGEVVGRVSSKIAQLLIGKSKPYFAKNLDCGDYVVVINAKDVTITGKKPRMKSYARHSGYPGGFRSERFEELVVRKPKDVIINGVKGMLPQNKLRASMLKRLYVFASEEHPYGDKVK